MARKRGTGYNCMADVLQGSLRCEAYCRRVVAVVTVPPWANEPTQCVCTYLDPGAIY